MAKLKVTVEGKGIIDNAVIYIEDPSEKTPYFLDPKSDKVWTKKNISIPLEGWLDYSLYVVAFSGTKFTCMITDENGKKVTFKGITGSKIKNRAHISGSKELK